MAIGFYVDVPEDLAAILATDGFRRSGSPRGVAEGTQLAVAALGVGANLATVFVARHDVARFVRHLWATGRRRGRDDRHVASVVIERDGRRVALSVEHSGFDGSDPSDDVLQSLVALIEALAPPSQGRTDT